MFILTFTKRSGVVAEWHYANEDVANATAEALRRGWRTDAKVTPR